jgi:hypothetical protein
MIKKINKKLESVVFNICGIMLILIILALHLIVSTAYIIKTVYLLAKKHLIKYFLYVIATPITLAMSILLVLWVIFELTAIFFDYMFYVLLKWRRSKIGF